MQCCVSLLCDFALVYLLAPTLAPSAAPASRLGRKVARLPAHVFQAALPGQPRCLPTSEHIWKQPLSQFDSIPDCTAV